MMTHAQPDIVLRPELYDGVGIKRLIAFVVDLGVTFVIALPLLLVPILLSSIVFWPMVLVMIPFVVTPLLVFIGFCYRWATITGGSATWGMRLMAIELRDSDGRRLDGTTAFLHTAGTTLCIAMAPLQLVSVGLMMGTERGQGLPDLVLGTVMLNRLA